MGVRPSPAGRRSCRWPSRSPRRGLSDQGGSLRNGPSAPASFTHLLRLEPRPSRPARPCEFDGGYRLRLQELWCSRQRQAGRAL